MTSLPWRQRLRKGLSRTLRPPQFWLRRQLLLTVDRLTTVSRPRPDSNRVLLVRADHIGDFVLWIDAARALTRHYRSEGKLVTLLGNAAWAAWAEELGICDAVLPLQVERYKKDLRYRLRTGTQLRRLGFGIAVHAAPTRVMEVGDALIRTTGATHKLGPLGSNGSRPTDKWYTRLIPIGSPATDELRRNAALASGLIGAPYQARIADLRGTAGKDKLGDLRDVLAGAPYFVLFPGASQAGRKWPAQRFAELAKQIHAHTGWRGIVCGGPGDVADAQWIVHEARPVLQSLAGRTDLRQLAAVLAGARLLVSNETSAVHIAATLGVPSVCIVGGGHFGRFMPYDPALADDRPLPRVAALSMPCFGCDWVCKFHPPKGQPMPCVEEVTLRAVWKEVEALLASDSLAASPLIVFPGPHNPTKDEAVPAVVGIGTDF